jgi:hypothetical protein
MVRIYIDETGMTNESSMGLVAAVMIENEQKAKAILDDLRLLIGRRVEPEFQENFHIHATDIFSNKVKGLIAAKNPDFRSGFIAEILTLIQSHKIPIVAGYTRSLASGENSQGKPVRDNGSVQNDYHFALIRCLAGCDKYMEMLFPGERAQVISENISKHADVLRLTPFLLSQQSFIETLPEFHSELPIRFIDPPMEFRKKNEEPLLQLADIIAFVCQRFAEQKSSGREFMDVLTWNNPKLPDLENNIHGAFGIDMIPR